MITYFTEQDLVSFGSFLISPLRKQAYIDYGVTEDKLEDSMAVINPLDLKTWINYLQEQRRRVENNEDTSNQ